MVLDPGHKPRGMQQNAIDYDGPISFIGNAAQIADAVVRVISRDRAACRVSRSGCTRLPTWEDAPRSVRV